MRRPRRKASSSLSDARLSARIIPASSRLLVIAFAILLLGSAAFAQTTIYHIRGNATAGSNSIWSLNPTTGAETLVYSGYPGGNAATLAQRPSDGMIFYAINSTTGTNGAVYRFNPATPGIAPVLLGNIGPSTGGVNVSSGFRMAFSPSGTLYYMIGSGGAADPNTLYTVDQTTGRATKVATITGTNDGGDMAFSSTGTLYVVDQNRNLFTALVGGGAATSLGTVAMSGSPNTIGIGFDGTGRMVMQTVSTTAGGQFWSVSGTTATLISGISGGGTATGDLASANVPLPNLSITKTDGVTTVYRGGSVTYTIVVTNNGTYDVTGTVSDTVPASITGVTWTCVASAGSSCAAASGSGNSINTSATLQPGDTATYTVTGTVSASASGTLTNTATVALPSWLTDSNIGNNTATDSDTINLNANLGITKTDGLTSVNPGANVTYTIVVSNAGPDTANGAIVTDTVPASLSGVTWTCGSPVGGATCGAASGSGNNISTTANLPAGGSITYTVTGTLSFSATGTLSNTASVITPASGVTDPNDPSRTGAGNNSATDSTTINTVSDLTIAKTHTGNFSQGQTGATYTLTVTNSGNAATSGTVTVTDVVPASLTPTAASGTGWTCGIASQTVTCTRSTALAVGASYPAITITVNVSATAPASVTNTANVSGGGETNTGNDSASDATIITQLPDLTIAKTHTGNFTRGSTGTYSLTVTNSGSAATSGTVTVTDTVPAGLTPTVASGTGWTCGIAAQTVTCTRSNALAAGASYPDISITVSVAQTAASSITNTASVSGGGQANTANDSSSDPTTIVSSADLSLTKVVTSSGSGVGTNATFTITLTNSGPSNATNVAVKDQLPAGLTYVSSTPSTGTYNSGTGVWTVASLASGVSATLQLVAQINSLGSITNTAQVTASDQPDPDSTPNNNNAAEDDQASASLSTSPPSITLCKTIQGQPCPPPSTSLPPGSDVTYVITFTNTGGSFASNFVITDPIPASTDFKVGSVTTTLGTTGLTVTVAYSNNGGTTWVYAPASGGGGAAAGYDRNVTHVRWSFTGNLSQLAPNNTGSVSFTVRIR